MTQSICSNITLLPPNLLRKILSYFSPHELDELAQICKIFENAVFDSKLWEEVCVQERLINSETRFNQFKIKKSNIEIFNLSKIDFIPNFPNPMSVSIEKVVHATHPWMFDSKSLTAFFYDPRTCDVFFGYQSGKILRYTKRDDGQYAPSSLEHHTSAIFSLSLTPSGRLISLTEGNITTWTLESAAYKPFSFQEKLIKYSEIHHTCCPFMHVCNDNVVLFNLTYAIISYDLSQKEVIGGLGNTKVGSPLRCMTHVGNKAFLTIGSHEVFEIDITQKKMEAAYETLSPLIKMPIAPLTASFEVNAFYSAINCLEYHNNCLFSISRGGTLHIINIVEKTVLFTLTSLQFTYPKSLSIKNDWQIEVLSSNSLSVIRFYPSKPTPPNKNISFLINKVVCYIKEKIYYSDKR